MSVLGKGQDGLSCGAKPGQQPQAEISSSWGQGCANNHPASILIPPVGQHLTMASTCRLQNTRTNKYGPFLADFELPPALPEETFDGSLRSVKEYLSGENTEHREVSFRGQRDSPVSQARALSFVLLPSL